MPTEIDARITPTLHPDNVASIDGFDEADRAVSRAHHDRVQHRL